MSAVTNLTDDTKDENITGNIRCSEENENILIQPDIKPLLQSNFVERRACIKRKLKTKRTSNKKIKSDSPSASGSKKKRRVSRRVPSFQGDDLENYEYENDNENKVNNIQKVLIKRDNVYGEIEGGRDPFQPVIDLTQGNGGGVKNEDELDPTASCFYQQETLLVPEASLPPPTSDTEMKVAVTRQSEKIRKFMELHFNNVSGHFECPYCSKKFPKGNTLYWHLIYECLGAPVFGNQSCPYCIFSCKNKRSLIVHMAREHMAQLQV